MDFNFDDYSSQLDELTGRQPNLGVADGNMSIASQFAQDAKPAANLAARDQPVNQSQQQMPDQPNKIAVMPPGFDAENAFDQGKLKDAKSLPQYVDAMHPKARNEFMDWWEQQHGSINQHYDQMHEQLGVKPSADRKLSRKDKWTMLMDFGINLIKASQQSDQGGAGSLGGALAMAAGNTVVGTEQRRNLEGQEFDQKSSAIEQGRQGALKNLGSYGDALKGQTAIEADKARQAMYEKERTTNLGQPTFTDQGLIERKPDGTWSPIKDEKGNPYTNKEVGARGGVARDTRTAKIKDYEYLTKTMGKDPKVAEIMAFAEKTGDPRKDHLSVYTKALSAMLGNAKKAKETADEYIKFAYGEGTNVAADSPQPMPTKPSVGPQKVADKAAYDALKPGTKYIAPDGSTRTKK